MKKILLSVIMTILCFTFSFAVNLPTGTVSIYSLNSETEVCPYTVPAVSSFQFVGPANGWGALTDHNLATFKRMLINVTYDAADGGKQLAIRFSVNGAAASPVMVTLPTTGTTYTVSIALDQYKDANGTFGLGGLVFYNGASHFSFSYDGTPTTSSITVNYIALSTSLVSEVPSIKADNPDALVNVYNMTGSLIRKNVKSSEVVKELENGLYLIGNKKVLINNKK